MEDSKYIISLNADSSLQIVKAGEVIVQLTKDELINATAETMLAVVAKRLDGVDEVAGASTAIQTIWNEFTAIRRNDTMKSAITRNVSVSWTVEVSEASGLVIDRKVIDPETQVEVVKEGAEHNAFLGIGELNAGIASNVDQPMAETYIEHHAAVHLNDPRYVGDSDEYDKTNMEHVIVNGYDRSSHSDTKVAITVGESWLVYGMRMPHGETPVERLSFMERSDDGDVHAHRVIRYAGNMFICRNVSPILNQMDAVSDDALRVLSGLESALREKSQTKQIVKALIYTGELKQQNREIKDIVNDVVANHLLFNDSAPINSLYALPDEVAEYACHNSKTELVKFAKGLHSMETFFALQPLANANTLNTAITEFLAEGQEHSWVRGTHGISDDLGLREGGVSASTGSHSIKFTALAGERIVARMVNRMEKILFTCDQARQAITDAAESVLDDKIIAEYFKDVVLAEQALNNIILDLTASPVRNSDSSAGNVPIILPSTEQFIIGLNPNEFIDYSASPEGTPGSQYHVTFHDNLHYKMYEKLDAEGNVVYKKENKYGLHTPSLLSLERLLEDAVKFERLFLNNGLNANEIGEDLYSYIERRNLAIDFNPNAYSVFGGVMGLAYYWMYKDVIQNKTRYSGYKHLLADVCHSGHTGVALPEVLAKVQQAVKDNTIQMDRVFASQFKYDSMAANKSLTSKYPICTIADVDMTDYSTVNGKKMGKDMFIVAYNADRDSEVVKHFENFEPLLDIEWDVRDLLQFEDWLKHVPRSGEDDVVFFGPTSDRDDVFASGDESRPCYSRTILLRGKKAAPVLFRKRFRADGTTLFYSSRANNKPDVTDLFPYGNVEEQIWKPDGFIQGSLGDAYILVQERNLDVTSRGNKLHSRSHTTIVDNVYYFLPVDIFKYGDIAGGAKGIVPYGLSELVLPQMTITTGEEKAKIERVLTGRVLLTKDDYVVRAKPKKGYAHIGCITEYGSDGRSFTYEGDDGKVGTFSLEVNSDGELVDIPSHNIVYGEREAASTQMSRYGYRRVPFLDSCFEVSNGDAVGLKRDIDLAHGWTTNGVWSKDPLRLTALRPHNYDIATIMATFPVGGRNDEPDRPVTGLQEMQHYVVERNGEEVDVDPNYEFNHVKSVICYSDAGSATLTGVETSIDRMAEQINMPLILKHFVHFAEAKGEVLTLVYRNMVTEGISHDSAVRINGALVTPIDDRYIDHINSRYLRGVTNTCLVPALFVADESGNSYECVVMWLGSGDYFLNRRLTERNNYGDIYSIAYPRLKSRLRDERRTNKYSRSCITQIFIDGLAVSEVLAPEGGNENGEEEDEPSVE